MKDPIDRMIRENMEGFVPRIEIDIRKETMSRIKIYEQKKARIRSFFQYTLMFFTALASLASLVLAETLFERLRIFLLLNRTDPLALKLVYQGFFASALIGLFILLILALNAKEDVAIFSES